MIFNTWLYGIFLLATFCLYWLAPERARPWLLIVFGCYFYWHYYPPHLVLILGMTVAVWLLAFVVQPSAGRQRRLFFALGVGGCVGTLAYYKYSGFLMSSLALVFPLARGTSSGVQIVAPLAISFFTFEFVHYLIEVYRGTFTPSGFRDFVLFIMFFPSLVCGPIKRFQQFKPQEYAQQRLDPANVHDGLERILFGLSKKTIIADTVAVYCAPVFANPQAYTWTQLWLGVYGYAMQIYFDFSGYSDIAIGSARLLGYRVPENFNYPYLQPNIAAFWRSWHMSLTSWITDYLYIPLGGNRLGEARAHLNRFLAMTICGLWHGAAFHFAVWGMYHGVGLNLLRGYQRLRGLRDGGNPTAAAPVMRALSTLFTFHFVCIGWVLFVCDLPTAWGIIRRLVGL